MRPIRPVTERESKYVNDSVNMTTHLRMGENLPGIHLPAKITIKLQDYRHISEKITIEKGRMAHEYKTKDTKRGWCWELSRDIDNNIY